VAAAAELPEACNHQNDQQKSEDGGDIKRTDLCKQVG